MIEEEISLKKPKRSKRRKNDTLSEREQEPLFAVGMASLFFDRSPWAFRALESEGYFEDLQKRPLEIHRTPGGDRRFSLRDLRYIAHSLRRHNTIDDRQLRLVLRRLDSFKEPLKYWTWFEGSEETKSARKTSE